MLERSLSRRRFIQKSLATNCAIGLGAAVPGILGQAAAQQNVAKQDNVLVVVQLSGGNDGLNCVVPYTDDAYYKARPKLSIPPDQLIKIDDTLGLHKSLRGLSSLLESNALSIVQGVGYASPNRSHFESMDIWHTCQKKEDRTSDGWLGRYIEKGRHASGGDVAALHLGNQQQPLALASRSVRVPSVKSVSEFRLDLREQNSLEDLLHEVRAAPASAEDDLLRFVESSTASAVKAADRVSEAIQDYDSAQNYPTTRLGSQLQTVAQLIDAGLSTSVYYLELDGFDTHAQQADAHSSLLKHWADAVETFLNDLKEHGHGERVCVMVFSEFGRRLQENASAGTDHGAAGPMFLCGQAVQAGLIGSLPSLTDLDDGDLRYAIDFRQVYTTILQSWLHAEARPIIGGSFEELPIFRKA